MHSIAALLSGARLGKHVAVAVAAATWLACAPTASAQSAPGGAPSPLIEEIRAGVLLHSAEASNAEEGVDLNVEVLFRRFGGRYDHPVLDFALRPRIHVGASVNTVGDTSQLYAGLSWDVKLLPKLSLELTFGGALHDGPTDNGPDAYGCVANFRESASLGYQLDDRWTVYGTVAHMSNADLCDRNTGITSVGVRLGYKLK
jgi:lipid A 3-O-deacylase